MEKKSKKEEFKRGDKSKQKHEKQEKVKLDENDVRKIRDLYFTNTVMLEIWNEIKKRKFHPYDSKKHEKEEKEEGKEENKDELDMSKLKVMKKKVYLDMIKSMYRIMIQGLSGNRIKKIKKDIQ